MKTYPVQRIPYTHRVLINRATKQEVGPRIPISPEDWHYGYLHPAELLWRYLDFWKFEDLLTSSELYLSRLDLQKDPFEGRFSIGNEHGYSASDKAFHEAYKTDRTIQQAMDQHEIHRRCCFVSCWHRSQVENQDMWNAYTESPESVVIATSAKSIYRFIDHITIKSTVKYLDPETPRSEFDWNSLAFQKTKPYQFEREFRILTNLKAGETMNPSNPADRGRRIHIQPKKIIHKVICHPKAASSFKQKVDLLLKRHLPHLQIANSRIIFNFERSRQH